MNNVGEAWVFPNCGPGQELREIFESAQAALEASAKRKPAADPETSISKTGRVKALIEANRGEEFRKHVSHIAIVAIAECWGLAGQLTAECPVAGSCTSRPHPDACRSSTLGAIDPTIADVGTNVAQIYNL